MVKDTINAVYTVKNDGRDIKKLASNIAVGQTIGIWGELPNSTRLQVSGYLAEVVSVEESTYTSTIKIAFPIQNFGNDLAALLCSLYGKISLAPKIRLDDIEFSQNYTQMFKGPRYGISGIREKLNVKGRPLLMSIFKPCLGLSAAELGNMFSTQAEAGVDIVKDDEVLYDRDFNSTLRRLESCLKAKEKTNSRTMYAINLTGQANEILDRSVQLEKNGADCILFNYMCYGLPFLSALRQSVSIPIMAHPAFSGAICLGTSSGVNEKLILGKLPRLAGADFVLFPSQYGSIAWDKTIVLSVHKELNTSFFDIKPSWSVPSAGIKANMVKGIVVDYGENIVINAGTAVWEYPEGGLHGAKEFVKEIQNLPVGVSK
jgi:2,3-diketo-5-methylthiopentyl-1-phosphate enolase